ncbi:MAG TPA: hypothetical protein VHG52_10690, partial [Thermomicrobiales bacterium]|nr:hypothetical protein [Thermomicrobiales bacterium]
ASLGQAKLPARARHYPGHGGAQALLVWVHTGRSHPNVGTQAQPLGQSLSSTQLVGLSGVFEHWIWLLAQKLPPMVVTKQAQPSPQKVGRVLHGIFGFSQVCVPPSSLQSLSGSPCRR